MTTATRDARREADPLQGKGRQAAASLRETPPPPPVPPRRPARAARGTGGRVGTATQAGTRLSGDHARRVVRGTDTDTNPINGRPMVMPHKIKVGSKPQSTQGSPAGEKWVGTRTLRLRLDECTRPDHFACFFVFIPTKVGVATTVWSWPIGLAGTGVGATGSARSEGFLLGSREPICRHNQPLRRHTTISPMFQELNRIGSNQLYSC